MSAFVVDTNVPMVANGKADHADPDCVIACVNALNKVRSGGIVVLDEGLRILVEYMNNLNMSGQPGPGDLFMKWVWSVQADSTCCKRVHITLRTDDPETFAEFPDDPALAGFDRSDMKFVAVALASQSDPEILNAVDSDWAQFYEALVRNRVRVTFLCPQHVCPGT